MSSFSLGASHIYLLKSKIPSPLKKTEPCCHEVTIFKYDENKNQNGKMGKSLR